MVTLKTGSPLPQFQEVMYIILCYLCPKPYHVAADRNKNKCFEFFEILFCKNEVFQRICQIVQ